MSKKSARLSPRAAARRFRRRSCATPSPTRCVKPPAASTPAVWAGPSLPDLEATKEVLARLSPPSTRFELSSLHARRKSKGRILSRVVDAYAGDFPSSRQRSKPPARTPELRLPHRPDLSPRTRSLADHSRQSVCSPRPARPLAAKCWKRPNSPGVALTPLDVAYRSPLRVGSVGQPRNHDPQPWPALEERGMNRNPSPHAHQPAKVVSPFHNKTVFGQPATRQQAQGPSLRSPCAPRLQTLPQRSSELTTWGRTKTPWQPFSNPLQPVG